MSQSVPEIQQIPARHGTATFVPKGHVIKITNTYGRQVVDTWAFALPKPPTQEEVDEQKEQEEQVEKAEGEEEQVEKAEGEEEQAQAQASTEPKEEPAGESQEAPTETGEEGESSQQDDGEEQAQEGEQGEGAGTETPKQEAQDQEAEEGSAEPNSAQKVPGSETETDAEKTDAEKTDAEKPQEPKDGPSKAGWSSYLPSMSRARGKAPQGSEEKKDGNSTPKKDDKQPKTWSQYLSYGSGEKENKTKTKDGKEKTWGSYFPSGKSFSNYVPQNVSISAFASSHHRDDTKSYAEQLYDFSKTPVGAGALSAATGSGYAGTAYAAYQAFAKQQEAAAGNPPMEYLSMPHTHSATNRLIPKVNDTLVSNLRQPMLTVIEDTAAVHDTVIAACDPQRYRELGVEKWEEHGSCAENLVLALKQINESAGLKGPKAVGADITVNTAPQPFNLFMNIPFKEDGNLSFEAPKGKKGEYIRLRAERDVVVVMSACPQDVLPINGGKCMAAHFIVQEPEKKKPAPKRPAATKQQSSSAAKKAAPAASQAKASTPASTQKPTDKAAEKPAAKPAPKPAAKPQPAKQPAATKAATDAPAKKASAPSTGTPTARKPSQPAATNGASPAATPRKQSTQSGTASSPVPKKPQPAPKAGKAKPKKLARKTTSQTEASESK